MGLWALDLVAGVLPQTCSVMWFLRLRALLLGSLKPQEHVCVWLCNFVGEACCILPLCSLPRLSVSHESIFLDKSVSQGCLTRQSFRNVLHECATRVFSNRIFKSVSQEFPRNLLAKRCQQCLRRTLELLSMSLIAFLQSVTKTIAKENLWKHMHSNVWYVCFIWCVPLGFVSNFLIEVCPPDLPGVAQSTSLQGCSPSCQRVSQ